MTPLWIKHIKIAVDRKNILNDWLEQLATSRCFDMRAVSGLSTSTAAEISRAAREGIKRGQTDVRSVDYEVDIGERTCFPAQHVWLEWGDVALGLVSDPVTERHLKEGEEGRCIIAFVPDECGQPERFQFIGRIFLSDGVARVERVVHADDWPSPQSLMFDLGTELQFRALAALAIMNSPSAGQSAIPAHLGVEKQIRAAAPRLRPREIEHVRVILGATHAEHSAANGAGHPRAYHFCRAHKRRLPSSEMASVRAHWRGDPAYGIRLPTYDVRSRVAA